MCGGWEGHDLGAQLSSGGSARLLTCRKLTVADWPEQVCYLDTCRYLLGDENAKDAHAAILNLLGQLPAHLLNLLSSAMEMLSSRQQTDEEADAARESGEAESMNHGSTAYGSATSSTAERMRRGRVASTAVSTEEAGIQAAAVRPSPQT
ncbi:hypothetical protein CYMTET_17283 [Cymbomonas tetramitiformis]|uniref:Uncharacterized protein n=1 Tax=Cymbomonas tetramitiformis TaxID=36881 RepID=A0AAE0GAY2_9CHLO|nr:hypothetical protein CYMTET_17283 [Cymbomonas tetramitiformis]